MSYVDGFVIPVPKKEVKSYTKMARMGLKTWMKHGAVDYKECVADDLKNVWGTTFQKNLKLKPGETVIFAFIVFKSRAHRDSVNKKVMKEMEKACEKEGTEMKMPFDIKRMVYGGFKTIVE